MSKPRVVLLCGQGYSTDVVYAGLTALDIDIEVVLESSPSPGRAFVRRVKRLGPVVAFGQLAFRILAVPWLRLTTRARITELRRELPTLGPITSAAQPYRVRSANDREAERLLREIAPELVVINGTRILSRELLEQIDAPIINMHAGITPLYRGVHGGYWALFDGRPDLFGTTVHRVDPGVDTGAVLARAFAAPTERDTFVSYPYLQLGAGLPTLVRVAEAELGLRERESVEPLSLPSAQRYHPTLRAYLSARVKRGVK